MRYLYCLLFIGFCSCDPGPVSGYQTEIYAPVYLSQQLAKTVSVAAPQPTLHPGKIYAYGNYLFQVEVNEGIHVIDNADPKQAHKISFLRVPAASELAIKSGFLYTNNLEDLIVIDISDISAPHMVKRVENAFPKINQEYPPLTDVYFECVDPAKGVVVGWEKKTVTELPNCRR